VLPDASSSIDELLQGVSHGPVRHFAEGLRQGKGLSGFREEPFAELGE